MSERWPSGVCRNCHYVFWSYVDATVHRPPCREGMKHDWELFTANPDGGPVGFLTAKDFNKKAHWRGVPITVKEVKKLDHPYFGWKGDRR